MSCGYDLTAKIGETLTFTIVYKLSDDTPIDIAADSVTWKIGATSYASPSLEVVVGPEPGTVHFLLTTDQVTAYGVSVQPYVVTLIDSAVPAGQGDLILLDGLIQFEDPSQG